jgi:hypothetical protein
MSKTIYQVLDRIEAEAEVTVPPDATPLEFLRQVYTDAGQPMSRRLRAAIECLPFVHPKLMVTASFDGKSFAAQLERAIERSGKAVVIEHLPAEVESSTIG